MVRRQLLTPLTTWHTQSGLLLISWTWGLSYLVPPHERIAFSEVFPAFPAHADVPMWAWGVLMLGSASVALVAERVITHADGDHPVAWRAAWVAHALLAGCYMTLAFAALVTGGMQAHSVNQAVTAISRPVLWGYIGYLHITFANLRRPQ